MQHMRRMHELWYEFKVPITIDGKNQLTGIDRTRTRDTNQFFRWNTQ